MRSLFWWLVRARARLAVGAFKLLGRLGMFTFYQPIPELGVATTRSMTALAHERWRAIERALPDGPMSVLDVGCNAGFFSIQMAKLGHFVTAVDLPTYYQFCVPAKQALDLRSLCVSDLELSPSSVFTLPRYDCVICMSIYHHWCRGFGTDPATEMLSELFRRTARVMFFESAQSDAPRPHHRDAMPDMGGSPERWIHDFFRSGGAARVETISENRRRYLVAAFK